MRHLLHITKFNFFTKTTLVTMKSECQNWWSVIAQVRLMSQIVVKQTNSTTLQHASFSYANVHWSGPARKAHANFGG